ncbi:MAG TPA: 4-alpha-glucanotransferase [Ilumatobacteraceae bacterium]|nr:4-alpha-glucanotransferase [Ilumatobacteraceae bacterium]
MIELARAYRVSTEFWDWRGEHRSVPEGTIVAALGAFDVDASTPEAIHSARVDVDERPWRRLLPATVVMTSGTGTNLMAHVHHGDPVTVWVELADGGDRWSLAQVDRWVEPRLVDGHLIGEATFWLPAELPIGYHTVRAEHPGGEGTCPLVVTPVRLELPATLRDRQSWGFMTQLYALRSGRSWGLGDLADLGDLAAWSAAEHQAEFVLVNPLHAAEPVAPMEPSPYRPTSRRFANPIYLRVEDVPEVAYLSAADRAAVEEHAAAMRALNLDAGTLDRDRVWAAKCAALELVHRQPRRESRQRSFDAFRAREGEGLRDFATWCALAERFGLPTSKWPDDVRDPTSAGVEALRDELADRVCFHEWLQWCLDEQLAAAQRAATDAGMVIGVVHDLAVGVHPDGADSWALSSTLARGVSVGAPPDMYNQLGQDWLMPPWRPDRLAEVGYHPYRTMLRTILRHAGGLRIDHVIGLFRLWWVPPGCRPSEGTYVGYDHEALVGILVLEAHRAGAVVVGEDLGTVEPWTRDYLRQRGILGTSVLWFEKDPAGKPLPPAQWREMCLATVTTHDLPPTAGYLAGEHIDLRDRLGLLTRPVDEERRANDADRRAVLTECHDLGVLADDSSEQDQVEALHRLLTLTPARLIGVSVADAIGDRRTINQPGTIDEYPNWRVPLTDGDGRPLLLEDIVASDQARSLAGAIVARSQPSSLRHE